MTGRPAENEPEILEGLLEVSVVDTGSKAQMPSAVLTTADRTVLLRRRQATRLDAEPELTVHAGRRVRVTGTSGWRTFVVDAIEPLD